MLNIQLTSEELNNPAIRKALSTFISKVTENTNTTWKAKNTSRKPCNIPSIKIEIDDEIKRKMSDSVKTTRSLYFLTLIKREGRISTNGLNLSMQQAFPDFNPKSLGGVTGSITRWCNQNEVRVPFKCSRDEFNTTTIYSWDGFKKRK